MKESIFTRTEKLIGVEGINILQSKKVLVLGLGGVGSFAAEALVRAGIGSLVLIDNDVVTPSNLNRQLHATTKTIGQKKVDVMKERILEINPDTKVETYDKFYLTSEIDFIESLNLDYIIDAIDTVDGKISIISDAQALNIRIISSMGTGNRLFPEKFEIANITKTSYCPLAKVMRKTLHKKGIKKVKVLYSKELKKINDNNVKSSKIIPGSISFVPPVGGFLIAGEVIKDFLEIEK